MHNYRKVHSKFLPRSIKHFQINSLNISNQFKFNLNRIYQFWLVSHDRSMKIKILHWTFCRHARCHHPKNKSIIYSFLANNNKNIENNKKDKRGKGITAWICQKYKKKDWNHKHQFQKPITMTKYATHALSKQQSQWISNIFQKENEHET